MIKDIMFEQGFEIAEDLIILVLTNSEVITTDQYVELCNEIEEEIIRYKNEQ